MRFLKSLSETGAGPVAVLVAFTFAVFAFLVCAALPVDAQGTGVGTLPNPQARTFHRISGLLDPWSTFSFQKGEVRGVIESSHNAEGNLANGGRPDDQSTMSAHWRSKHMDLEVKCPRLESDGPGSEGDQVQAARLSRMIASLQTYFPPDGTMVEVPDFCPVFELDELVLQDLPTLEACSGARLQ